MFVRGAFDLRPTECSTWTPQCHRYDLGRYPAGIGWEPHAGFAFLGTDGGGVHHAKVYDQWGDGVMLAFDGILDTNVRCNPTDGCHWQVARNIVVDTLYVKNVSRTCAAPTQGINNTIRNSTFVDCWFWGLDAEADGYPAPQTDMNGPNQTLHNNLPLQGLKVLNNTFDGSLAAVITIPVGGDYDTAVKDHEVRGNTILRPPSNAPCTAAIMIGVDGYSSLKHARVKSSCDGVGLPQ